MHQSVPRTKRPSILTTSISAAFLTVLLTTAPALAAPVSWDSDGVFSDGITDGSGPWDLSTPDWSNGTTDNIWNNLNNDTAVFGDAGSGGATAETITLGTGITVGGLIFNSSSTASGYTIAGNTLTLAGAAPAITVNSNAAISSVLAGTSGLSISGTGTLTFTGLNTYSGGTVVNSGTLVLGAGGATGTIRGALTINPGAAVVTTVADALGYGGGTAVTSVNINGGTMDNASSGNEGYITNFNLAGGTLSSSGNGAYNFNTGFGITTSASSTTSLITAPISIRGGSLGFNIAQGTTANGIDLSVTGTISTNGGTGIIKTGLGTMQLAGTNSYTGTTTINAGTLLLDFSAAGAPASNILNAATTLALGGGTLDLAGGATVANNQQFAALTVNPGASAIQLNVNAIANPLALSLGTITRNAGGTVDFTLPAGAPSMSNGITTAPGTAGAILSVNGAAFATVGGSDWAALDATGSLVTGLSTIAGGYTPTTATSLTGNADVASGVNTTLTSATTISSLRFNLAQATTITLSSVTLATGGILVTPAVGANLSTITGGILQGAAGNDLVIIENDPASTLTIQSTITNSGATATGLTKSGPGYLTLTAANTYTGTTYVNGGTLEVQAKSTDVAYIIAQGASLMFGYSTGGGYTPGITLNGSGLGNAAGLYLLGGKNIQTNGGLVIQTAPTTIQTYGTGNATLQGFDSNSTYFLYTTAAASGSAATSTVNFNTGSYGYVIQTDAGANTDTGDLTLNGVIAGSGGANTHGFPIAAGLEKTGTGSLKLTGASTYSNATGIGNGSVILSSANNRLPIGTTVILGSGATSGRLVLGDSAGPVNQTIAVLQSNGSGTANAVVGGSSSVSTLTVNNSAAVTYAGLLGGSGVNQNNLALTKTGAGTLILTGTNTYSGPTSVNAGELDLNSASAIGTGTLLLSGGNIDNTTAGAITLTANNSQSWNGDFIFIGTNSLNLGTGAVTLGGNRTITIGTNTLTVGGAISGAFGLTKAGLGTLLLTGSESYSGSTTVSAGTLALGGTAILGTGGISVASGSVLDVSALTAGSFTLGSGQTLTAGGNSGIPNDVIGNVTLGGGTINVAGSGTAGTLTINGDLTLSGGGVNFDLSNVTTAGGGLNDLVSAGNLTLTSPTNISVGLLNGALPTGTYTLFDYAGAFTGSAANLSVTGASGGTTRQTFTFATTGPTDGAVTLAVAGSIGNLTWVGGSSGNAWDLVTTKSFLNSGAPDKFYNGDLVTFDDTGSSATPVTITGTLLPGSVTVNNSLNPYTFAGSGSISGGTGLTKNGSNTLTILNNNSFTGTVAINQGFISIGTIADGGVNSPLGAGTSISLGDAGTDAGDLQYTGDAASSNRSFTLNAGGGIIEVIDSGTLLTLPGLIGGAGMLTLPGPGALALAGANTFSGGVTLNGGVLDINNASALGTGPLVLAGGNLDNTSGSAITLTTNNPQIWNSDFAFAGTSDLNLGTGPVTLGSSRLVVLGGGTFTVGGVISGAFDLSVAGEGTFVLGGTNTYSGNTLIEGGTLLLANPLALQNTTLNYNNFGGTLSFGTLTSATIGALEGSQALALANDSAAAVALTVGGNGGTTTYSGILSGPGSLIKAGSGYLTLTAANTYTGTTYIDGGTLEVQAKSGDVSYVIAQGATLMFGYSTGGGYTPGITLNGSGLGNPAGLYLLGGKTIQTNGGLVIQTAPTTIQTYGTGNATLQGFDSNSSYFLYTTADASGSAASSTVNFNTGSYGYVIQTDAGANTTTGDLTINGVISGSGGAGTHGFPIDTGLEKTGTGSLKLTGASTYGNATGIGNGSVILSDGDDRLPVGTTLILGSGGSSGLLVLGDSAGPVNQTIAGLQSNGSGTANAVVGGSSSVSTLTVNNPTAVTYAGLFGGTDANQNNLALSKAGTGTLTLSGANTYAGATTIAEGTVIVSGSISGSTAVSIGDGSTLVLGGSGADGQLNGAASVSLGAGVLMVDKSTDASTTGSGSITGYGGLQFSVTTGALTFGSGSMLDLGSTSGVATLLHFLSASDSEAGDSLTIYDYDADGNTNDHIVFDNPLSPAVLSEISLEIGGASSPVQQIPFAGANGYAGGYELVAVPEPAVFWGGAVMLGLMGFRKRRIAKAYPAHRGEKTFA